MKWKLLKSTEEQQIPHLLTINARVKKVFIMHVLIMITNINHVPILIAVIHVAHMTNV